MKGVTAIEPEWIPTFCPSLCHMGKPLETPGPVYDPETGTLRASVKGSYGKQGWELPIIQIEYPKCLEKYKLFSQYLLEGQIFTKLTLWKLKLLSLPVTMVKSWAKLQPRTQTFLQALAAKDVDKKSDLEEIWKTDKMFLLKEYLEWLPPIMHSEVSIAWPPIDSKM